MNANLKPNSSGLDGLSVFRADQVGSFLRPQAVKDAHTAYTQGQLSVDQLREIEDRAILDVLELQKQVGVDIFSDGEFRRGGWPDPQGDRVVASG